jgi:hypothetical protein
VEKVMGTEPWKGKSLVEEGDDYPAVYISWDDAVAFCKKLSDKEGRTYRLPTEAEWWEQHVRCCQFQQRGDLQRLRPVSIASVT